MRIVSWNVLAQDFDYKKRIPLICKEIQDVDPDVICIQEAIPAFGEIILAFFSDYVSPFEHVYVNNTSARPYGEIILSRLPIVASGYKFLRSYNGRVNSWIDIDCEGSLLRVNTAHLESCQDSKYKDIRQIQLKQIVEMNKDVDRWVWIGDSNLGVDEENSMHSTGDSTYYGNRFYKNASEYEYDKVWLNNLELRSVSLIGTEQIDGIWLSDHDGLVVDIK